MMIAGLMADDQTSIFNLYHIDRGYESPVEKLRSVGAVMERVPLDQNESMRVSEVL